MNTRIPAKLASIADRKKAERRRARRVAPGKMTPCIIRAADGGQDLPGWVHNLSVQGVGMLSARPFTVGDAVTVLFINAAHTFAMSAQVRVVRSYRVANGDYFLGGQFAQSLRYDELLPFVL